jgi:hypothetical protein
MTALRCTQKLLTAMKVAPSGREPLGGLVAESVAHAPEAGGGDKRA